MKKFINKYQTFIKYIFSAGLSFALDLTLFTVFTHLLRLAISNYAIIVATILARIISSFINYHLNRNKVFKKSSDNSNSKIDKTTFVKYVCLVVVQMFVSSFTVYALYNATHLNETLIKIPVEVVLFMVNYFVQKIFIFNDKKSKKLVLPESIRPVINILLSVVTTFAFFVELNATTIVSFSRKNTSVLTMLIFGILVYIFYKKYLKTTERRTAFSILTIMFTLLLIFGYSFDLTDSTKYVYSNAAFVVVSLVKFIGFYTFINLALNKLYDYFIQKKNVDFKNNKIIKLFNEHPFIFSICIIIICYIPYFIAYYPAIMGFDPANQIKEFLGIHTRYMDSVVLIDPNVTITNFNPIIHTLLLGGCFKLGIIINNVNLGLFLYSVIQASFMIGVLAYSIKFLKGENISNKICLVILAIYALVPIFPFYSLSTNKDTFFSLLILLYVIKMYQLIKHEYKLKNAIVMIITALFLFLLRNNGIYTFMLSMPFAFIVLKDKRKMIGITILATLLLYVGYNKVLLPHFKITQTSIREVLSIPFQQTAVLIKTDEKIISEKDKEIIGSILDYDTIKKSYDPELADKVKNTFNREYKYEELKEYFNVWFKYLYKKPLVYIDATINNMYGYFYPNTSKWNLYYTFNTKLPEAGFDYHYNGLEGMRSVLSGFGNAYQYIPVIGMLINIGFVVWTYMYLFASLIVNKNKKFILLLLPAFSLILVCVASPANAYFRYALPYIMSLPLTIALLHKNKKNS